MLDSVYVTTAIPYVNAEPHLGHALELVQADVLARHRRLRAAPTRLLTGTDDNALKNVTAARDAGVPVAEFVTANASRFAALHDPLALSYDDFISTASDPRHAPGVQRLWRRIAAQGDLYRHRYDGLYCSGCERFYDPDELTGGTCAEHGVPPERVVEQNWFFRLSRYSDQLLRALESGRLRVEPAAKRHEVLAFVRNGLRDFSVSRPAARAGGWGIPVPDDPEQVVYVWLDALANYVTALGYGTGDAAYERWWTGSSERIHVVGKGILRFHAVYWPALLLAAGEPLPTTIFVHDYLTADGAKISKSAGTTADPVDLARRYGTDAVRWWLLSEVPRVGDADFTEARLAARHDGDLAHGLGNLVNRTVAQARRFRDGGIGTAPVPGDVDIVTTADLLPAEIDRQLAVFDFRAATDALRTLVDAGNRLVEAERPWELARRERDGDGSAGERLDGVLTALVHACRVLAAELAPFLPGGARQLQDQLGSGGSVGEPGPAFPRVTAPSLT
ncbi:methionyl-tRNA synthetase [Haloactinopolyspora alba]|uniref:Methionine--tRNA ligase n=1 Tax=Haloactinopolyspora alba TaxID=648780 RepID=A0A2P8DN92_9ACTN|nr:methionine--tRNA ligase [Haloactinopolyspora alba]PSK98674.1 methionyl-tRNA synthetase [Haloactinopolyspora alba]